MVEATIVKWDSRSSKTIMEKAHMQIPDIVTAKTDGTRIVLRKQFRHKTFAERLAEYGGKIDTCDFEWGEPVEREGI